MQNTFKKLPIFLLLLWLLTVQVSCPDYYNRRYYENTLVPVYADSVKMHQVLIEPPHALKNSAKIYYKDSIIYVIEKDSGIHVVDNRVPTRPTPIRFIKMRGCADIAIKGNIMYADNYTDLVSIDISNPNMPKMVSRIQGMYPIAINGEPALKYRGYWSTYQCIDTSKGKVIAWDNGQLDTLKCYRRF